MFSFDPPSLRHSYPSAQSSTDCDEDTDTDTLGDNSTIASDTPTENDNHNAHEIATDNANVIASENLNANANGPDLSLPSNTDKVIWISSVLSTPLGRKLLLMLARSPVHSVVLFDALLECSEFEGSRFLLLAIESFVSHCCL